MHYTVYLSCACGALVEVQLYDSVNVDASPELRKKINNRSINTFNCNNCGLNIPIIKQFLYVDIKNNFWIWCYPDSKRSEKVQIEKAFNTNEKYQKIENIMKKLTEDKPQLVFGYNELLNVINNKNDQKEKTVLLETEELKYLLNIIKAFLQNGKVEKNPKLIIISGGVGAGKTTIIKEKFSVGNVYIDAAQIHLILTGNETKKIEKYNLYFDFIGMQLVKCAIEEKYNIIVEIIGDKIEPVKSIIDKMIAKKVLFFIFLLNKKYEKIETKIGFVVTSTVELIIDVNLKEVIQV